MATIAFDIDKTIAENGTPENDFIDAIPIQNTIDLCNMLYDEGNEIFFFTARSSNMQISTLNWLKQHNVKFDYLIMDKPHYDVFIDDKCIGWGEGLTKTSLKNLMDKLEEINELNIEIEDNSEDVIENVEVEDIEYLP